MYILRLLPHTHSQTKLKIDFPQMTLAARNRYRYRYKTQIQSQSQLQQWAHLQTQIRVVCALASRRFLTLPVSLPVSLPACQLYLMDTFGRVTIYNSTRCTTLVVPPISQYCLPLVSKLKCKCLHYLYVMYICIHTHTHMSIFPHYVCCSCAVGLKIDKLVGDNNS